MSLWYEFLSRRSIILFIASVLVVLGVWSWWTIPRQEDPTIRYRIIPLAIYYPGADAETIERLIVEPVEEQLEAVEEIHSFDTTIRVGGALIVIRLWGQVDETDRAWDRVDQALQRARQQFPEGASEPILRRDAMDQESVVLAVTGDTDLMVLAEAAERLKSNLLRLPEVARIFTYGDPGQQITIELNDAVARRLNLNAPNLVQQLMSRNVTMPSGWFTSGNRMVALRPHLALRSLQEIENTPILLPSGAGVPLGEVAEVRWELRQPVSELMRVDGRPAIGLGIIPADGVDWISFGQVIQDRVEVLRSAFEPLGIEEVLVQSEATEARLDSLSRTLLFSLLVVSVVLFVTMGLRLGLLVAIMLPLTVLSALAVFDRIGGRLEQISIGAFVLSLGLLVDNAIVVTENIQFRLDRGQTCQQAATSSVRQLSLPLAVATGTTLAMFFPLLLTEGNMGEFIRSLPVVVLLSLTMSYFYAIAVVPPIAARWLPKGHKTGRRRFSRWLGRLSVRYPFALVAIGIGLVVAALLQLGQIDRQFFPSSDYNQLMLTLTAPPGTDLDTVNAISTDVEQRLNAHRDVVRVASVVGASLPRFHYTLPPLRRVPNLAQILVILRDRGVTGRVEDFVRGEIASVYPEIQLVVSRLEQGGMLTAPVEVRVYGSTHESRHRAATLIRRELQNIPGTREVRSSLDPGTPSLDFEIDDAAATRRGITRFEVGLALLARTHGLDMGDLQTRGNPVPIVIRTQAGTAITPESLASTDVASATGQTIPLAQVAEQEVTWRPASIHRRNGRRVVYVMAQVAEDVTFNRILSKLQVRLNRLRIPTDVELEFGGAYEASNDANESVIIELPIGILLMLLCLLVEFNSFRRVALILVTVPLAGVGVIPGLVLFHQPFGFPSLVGVVALMGIIVNNAILLLDVVERERNAGASVPDALVTAVQERTRPILLTTATTVGGMTPLLFSQFAIWPPLASAMISGLISSTFLTLLVLPSLYRITFVRFSKVDAPKDAAS